MKNLYWKFCNWIGYIIVFKDWYDVETFTLKKKNSHMAILKMISKEDVNGHVSVKEVVRIQIRKI